MPTQKLTWGILGQWIDNVDVRRSLKTIVFDMG